MLRPVVLNLGDTDQFNAWISENLRSPFTGAPAVVQCKLDEDPKKKIEDLKLKLRKIQSDFIRVLAVLVPRHYKTYINDIVYVSKQHGNFCVLVDDGSGSRDKPLKWACPTKAGFDLLNIKIEDD